MLSRSIGAVSTTSEQRQSWKRIHGLVYSLTLTSKLYRQVSLRMFWLITPRDNSVTFERLTEAS
jgi:hypothetical protein